MVSSLRWLLFGLWILPLNPCLITCDWILGLLQAIVEGPVTEWHDSTPQQALHEFGSNLTHVQVHFHNVPDSPRRNSQPVINVMGSDSSLFKDKWLHTFTCFACQWRSHIFSTFSRDHTALELEKRLTNLCSSHCLLEATFIILKMCVPFYPSLMWNLMQTHCCLKSYHFLVCKVRKWNNKHLYLRGHYSLSIPATALCQTAECLSRLYFIYI